jgi:hypothetical protein
MGVLIDGMLIGELLIRGLLIDGLLIDGLLIDALLITVPEFIDPDLGMKTSIFVKNSPKCSVSFQFVARDAGISMFW